MYKILLVDNDASLGQVIDDLFKVCFGCESVVVNSTEKAAKLLENENFDLIISDIYVGGESSFSLAKETHDRRKPIPFIFFTDFGVDSSPLHYKEHIFIVVHKPHILTLLDRVCSLMSWSINNKMRV